MAEPELVRAKLIRNDCPTCFKSLLEEAKSLGGLPLGGKIVLVPAHWIDRICPHGQAGVKFESASIDAEASMSEERDTGTEDVDFGTTDSKMDASKNIGYPVRERGPYGSHPGHDDFDDESGPDGPGTY